MNDERPSKPTIDERLDRLVERHEALAQSIELLTHDVEQMRQGEFPADMRDADRARLIT
jgi:hypothetical protein